MELRAAGSDEDAFSSRRHELVAALQTLGYRFPQAR